MPKASPAEERRSRTREEFVDAAVRTLEAIGPGASMEDIAREAGTTKPRLYRHFTDKADLYQAIARRTTDDIYKLIIADFNFLFQNPKDALHHALSAFAEVVTTHPNVFRYLEQGRPLQDADSAPLSFGIVREITRRFADVAAGTMTAAAIDPAGVEYAARSAMGAIVAATGLWLDGESPDDLDKEQFVDQMTDLVWGLLDAFLRRKGIVLDLSEPLFVALSNAKSVPQQGDAHAG